MTITWKYAAGDESVGGFKEAFEKGGKVVKELSLPFPNVEFQALLTEIAATKPDAVSTFFAGSGAVKFVKDYAAAGLKDKIPLYGAGFLTDGTLEAQGEAATGMFTTLHYADSLNTPRDNTFRLAYAKAYKLQPGRVRRAGLRRGADAGRRAGRREGRREQEGGIRGGRAQGPHRQPARPLTISASHNPVQDIYLRQVGGKENKYVSVASRRSRIRAAAAGCSKRSSRPLPARTCQATSLMDLATFPHPVPELGAVRAAAVPGRQWTHPDLRDHGRDQPGARQLLHDRRWRLPSPIVASTFGGGFFATLVSTALAIVLGYVLEWAFYSYLYERDHLQQVLMTYG